MCGRGPLLAVQTKLVWGRHQRGGSRAGSKPSAVGGWAEKGDTHGKGLGPGAGRAELLGVGTDVAKVSGWEDSRRVGGK